MMELSIEEHDAINMADESKALLFLSRHPLRFLVQRRGPLKVIPFILVTIFLLVLIIICDHVAKRNSTYSGDKNAFYTKIELAKTSDRTIELMDSLNTQGVYAMGVSTGLHLAISWFYAADLMLLILLVSYKLHHEKRTRISQNRWFVKLNKGISAIGYVLTWWMFIPSLLYGVAQILIFAQLLNGASDALSAIISIFVIAFLGAGVAVGLLFIILFGLYVIILLLLARKYGYFWYKRQSV
jgi:hypothetical protein